jgi:hypothetical protein
MLHRTVLPDSTHPLCPHPGIPHPLLVLPLIDVIREQRQYRRYRNDTGEEISLDPDLL